MNVSRIDSHQHFWHYEPTKHVWMDDRMGIIKQDFLPADLLPNLKGCGLDGCVAVQANQAEIENEFLLKLAAENDFIKGIVGWVDLRAENVSERLEYYQQFSKIKGFRHVIHDEPELDFMLGKNFMNGVSKLNNYGYTYDILIFEKHLPNTIHFIEALPNQPFVIDHIAKPLIKDQIMEDWATHIKKAGNLKNVYCKISAMTTEANWQNWAKTDFTKYLDVVVEAFGTERIMYGSDWPVCQLAASYEAQFDIVQDYFSNFSQAEQDNFFGGNAKKFYKIEVP
jgi:L-fuconolactonase